MYGEPALPPDFVSLPYANPNAPKGGTIVFGEIGGFDSLNPYILKGRAPTAIQTHVVETLMARNWDEPFSLYGLLAESIETGPERDWVEFTLRPEARFSDGSTVTVEDVIWSMETLSEEGLPRYRNAWEKITRARRRPRELVLNGHPVSVIGNPRYATAVHEGATRFGARVRRRLSLPRRRSPSQPPSPRFAPPCCPPSRAGPCPRRG
jgi:ABC-type transport system substrate-binding protein